MRSHGHERRDALDALSPQVAVRAFVYHDHLILLFRDGEKQTVFKADWKENVLEEGGEARFRTTLFEADFAHSQELAEPLPVTGSDRVAAMLANQM